MAYKTTNQAAADIIACYIYGAKNFGVPQAEAYAASLVKAFELIDSQPHISRERTELAPPARVYFHRSHVIVYLIGRPGEILIVRVLHGRQDWEQLFT